MGRRRPGYPVIVMGIVEGAADDDIVVRSVVTSVPRWLVYLYAVQAGLALLLAVGNPDPWRWGIVGFWLVAAVLFAVLRRRERRRGALLTLTREGLTFRPAFGRVRTYPWRDIERLDIDPAGGARVANVTLRSGRWHRLVVVPDEQVDQVKARWAAVQAERTATGRPARS